MLLLGIAVGSSVVHLARAQSAPDVSDRDVVVLVAKLYEREKSIFNARERLAFLNRPAVEMADLAADTLLRDRPAATRDIESTRALAEALRQNEREINRQTDGGSTSFGVIGVVILSMAIGLAVLRVVGFLRGRGHTLPLATGNLASGKEKPFGRAGNLLRPLLTSMIDGAAVLEKRSDVPAAGRKMVDSIVQRVNPRPQAPPRMADPPAPAQERTAVPERRSFADTFTIHYDIDRDNDVDFMHAILGPNGERQGLCGLSMTESCDGTRRYYGLTIWVQQYRDDQLTTVGVITPSADRRVSAKITNWQRDMSLSSVISAHDGLEVQVATDDIAIVARFGNFAIDPDKTWMPDYFSSVIATFEIASSHSVHR
ncbi:MAG: hypothetical protein EPO26_08600 [Chloroflexota bacterium]|nr:MAG: hypothetical protein EPO26_08600 [Chloroflexota bacterium]